MVQYASHGLDGIEDMLTQCGYSIDRQQAESTLLKNKKPQKIPTKSLTPLQKLKDDDMEIVETLPESSTAMISKSTMLKESMETVMQGGLMINHTNINVCNQRTSFNNWDSGDH